MTEDKSQPEAMSNKTMVTVKYDDRQHNEYSKGETGYIDGYVRGGDDKPYAVLIINERLVLIPFFALKVVKP